jgi:lipoate-protein ligase A
VRRQASIGYEIVFDLLREKANGSAQLDIGQALLPKIEDCFETDVEILAHLFGCPKLVMRRRGILIFRALVNRWVHKGAGIF